MNKKLSEISTIKIGYSFRERPDVASGPDAVQILLPKNIMENNKIDFDDVVSTIIPNPGKFILCAGEVLLQSRGKFIATTYNPPRGQKYIASSLLLRIIVRAGIVMPEYIALYLNSALGQDALKRALSGGVMTPIITKSELEKIEIPVISMAQQKKLIALAANFNIWTNLHAKQLELQSQIFNNIVTQTIGANND